MVWIQAASLSQPSTIITLAGCTLQVQICSMCRTNKERLYFTRLTHFLIQACQHRQSDLITCTTFHQTWLTSSSTFQGGTSKRSMARRQWTNNRCYRVCSGCARTWQWKSCTLLSSSNFVKCFLNGSASLILTRPGISNLNKKNCVKL